MKPKIIIAMFGGLLACGLAVSAQNTPAATPEDSATSTNAVAQSEQTTVGTSAVADATTTNDAAQPSMPVEQASDTNATDTAGAAVAVSPAADTNGVSSVADTSTNIVSTTDEMGTNEMGTNSVATMAGTSTNAAEAMAEGSDTNAAAGEEGEAAPQPIIPLIVMDDVRLTDAIKNLARQANLNYMLDPKLAYGQPGPDGKMVPQPSVSIRWENVTAEQALNALLSNYGLQMVEDPRTKIARVTIKDPAAPDPLETKIIRLNFASPSNILVAVQTVLASDKRSKVIGDTRTSQLVVVGTEKQMDEIDKLVKRLDTPTKQVLIEAKLLETSINPSTIKGLDWSGTLQGQNLAVGNNLQQNSASKSLNNTLSESFPKMLFDTAKGFNPATAFLDADGVNVVFSFLNQNSEAKVISEPRTVTLDNETAHLEVTRATPIINVTAGTANTTGGSQITYTNLGVILDVTPRISANDFINLKIVPQVSRKFDTVTKTIQGQIFQADEYDVRQIDTRVMIPSGNTLVLGGLVQDDIRNENTKVPVLGDIPGLGYLFRSDSKSRQKSNLLVFITPTIVGTNDFRASTTDFLKTPMPNDKVPDWSAWDSGKPYDWGKKGKEDPIYQPLP